jgi:hypothetical protein
MAPDLNPSADSGMPQMILSRARWALALSAGFACCQADASEVWQLRQQTILSTAPVADGVTIADFDRDGRDDFVSLSPTAISVGGCASNGGDCGIKQTLVIDASTFPQLAQYVGSSDRSIFVTSYSGLVEYGGWPLRELRRIPGQEFFRAMIGDVDGDGDDEILRPAQDELVAHDRLSLQVEWTWPIPNWGRAELAQLDTDPALEILVPGLPEGLVIDGASGATEWSSEALSFVHLASHSSASSPGFYHFGSGGGLVAVSSQPYGVRWTRADLNGIEAIASAELTGDGVDEAIVGTYFGDRELQVVDGATGITRSRVALLDDAVGIGVGRLDGSSVRQIVVATAAWLRNTALRVIDAGATEARWSLAHENGNHSLVARGDVDADGDEEFVVASAIQSGKVRVVDARTNQSEWMSPPPDTTADLFHLQYLDVLLAQLDADAALEIVLVGSENWRSTRILVIDGASHEIELRIDREVTDEEDVFDAELFDLDGDGVPELILGSVGHPTGGGYFVHAISLQDGRHLWRSPSFGSEFPIRGRVLVAQTDADPQAEFVFALPSGLHAVDSVTHQVDWQQAHANAAAALRTPASGPQEFLLANGATLVRINAQTRAVEGQSTLPFPIEAIQALPGEPDWVVLAMNDRLHRYDLVDATLDGSTGPLGGRPAEHGFVAPAIVPRGWSIVSGSDTGYFEHFLADRSNLFANGFE